ncbi:hypothetical protein D3C76_1163960 [compost metagenome]
MGHELAEVLLITFAGGIVAQLARQFRHEVEGRWVSLERVLRIMGNIRDDRGGTGGGVQIRGDQQNADQARVHHRQVVIADGLP